VRRVDQAHHPEHLAVGRIGIKRIDAVVLSRDEHHVVLHADEREIGGPQRLSIDNAVDRARSELAEARRRHRGWRECVFLGIGAITRNVVVVRGDARKVGDCDDRALRLGSIGGADGENRVLARLRTRGVDTGRCQGADAAVAAGDAIDAPRNAARRQ
jgi:hypothetical protein